MNATIPVFAIYVEAIICYIICMTVPLMRGTIDQSVSYLTCQKYLKDSSLSRSITSWHQSFRFNMRFKKESQLAAFALKNDSGLEKMSSQRRSCRCCFNKPFKGLRQYKS